MIFKTLEARVSSEAEDLRFRLGGPILIEERSSGEEMIRVSGWSNEKT